MNFFMTNQAAAVDWIVTLIIIGWCRLAEYLR